MKSANRIDDVAQGGHRSVEPGLLGVFRLFAVLVIGVLVLRVWMATAFNANLLLQSSPWPGIILLTLLLGYLCSSRVQHWLGRGYLPLAIVLFVALALAGTAAASTLRVNAGLPGSELARGSWVLIVILVVPLVLVAWQYGFRWALVYCLVTAVGEICLVLPLAQRGGLPLASLIAIALVRTIVLLPVGYAVARLMDVQRRQRAELADANARLARYAATLESLAAERERNRLAHELHDTLAHGLGSIAVQLEAMTALWSTKPDAVRTMLGNALLATRTALSESRRAITALRARPLEDMGLALALRQLAESTTVYGELKLTLELPATVEGLDSETEHAVYRIAAEAIANAVRHANAECLRVSLVESGDDLQLTVADDGCGFDTADCAVDGHFGLHGLRERAFMIGAEFVIDSAPGKGTTLRLRVGRNNDTRPDM